MLNYIINVREEVAMSIYKGHLFIHAHARLEGMKREILNLQGFHYKSPIGSSCKQITMIQDSLVLSLFWDIKFKLLQ